MINGARIFGIRPGSPFLYKIAATGTKPLRYAVRNLPAGLTVDSTTGLITGALEKEGEFHMQISVSNTLGHATRGFTVRCGPTISLTPPMGWNSWNCWGLSVDDTKVRSSAQALLDKGLADHGWNYINIDDAWQARRRTPQGRSQQTINSPT
ncbi:putative Ig domain-containing protein [Puia sp. P3]|uniref:putative Ig domain-containing protein n=1 Tax=Puia sp. P3 TaxID=3423952 RepID=UPI003D6709F4